MIPLVRQGGSTLRIKIQMLIESDGLQPVTTDVATLHREESGSESLGLHMTEAKALLERMQSTIVTAQVAEFIERTRHCADCSDRLALKGHHDIVYRTVFGKLKLDSPRFFPCQHWHSDQSSFSPLSKQLVERTSPE